MPELESLLCHPISQGVSATSDKLRGAAASGGRARGTARVLHHREGGATLRPGEILVCVESSAAWTPFLSIAAGIVTETGGALSSLATSARERGVPTVVGLRNATTRIRNGQVIEIDGVSGVVSLKE